MNCEMKISKSKNLHESDSLAKMNVFLMKLAEKAKKHQQTQVALRPVSN